MRPALIAIAAQAQNPRPASQSTPIADRQSTHVQQLRLDLGHSAWRRDEFRKLDHTHCL